MKIEETALPGVRLITPRIFDDNRGAFWETWNQRAMEQAGLAGPWVQDNFSHSRKNVLRGVHYQILQPQGKLVRASHGSILDVAVDLRRSSKNFGRHVAVELTADSGQMLWIPIGFGHAFLALTEDVSVAYKTTDYYSPAGERTILWNDPELAIAWPVAAADAVISDKDRTGVRFHEAEVFA